MNNLLKITYELLMKEMRDLIKKKIFKKYILKKNKLVFFSTYYEIFKHLLVEQKSFEPKGFINFSSRIVSENLFKLILIF